VALADSMAHSTLQRGIVYATSEQPEVRSQKVVSKMQAAANSLLVRQNMMAFSSDSSF